MKCLTCGKEIEIRLDKNGEPYKNNDSTCAGECTKIYTQKIHAVIQNEFKTYDEWLLTSQWRERNGEHKLITTCCSDCKKSFVYIEYHTFNGNIFSSVYCSQPCKNHARNRADAVRKKNAMLKN